MSLLAHRCTTAVRGALSARPYTPSELDAHPDAARIWATIFQMRRDLDAALAYAEGQVELTCPDCEARVFPEPIFATVEAML